MKILFIGLGSIGKRHLINVKQYLSKNKIKSEIHCLKSKKSSNLNKSSNLKNDVDKVLYSISDLDNDYDCIFITNPTHKH